MSSGIPSIKEIKNQLRKQITNERSLLPEDVRNQKSAIICQRTIKQIQLWLAGNLNKKAILYTYIPFKAEIKVMPIVEWCWQNKMHVAAPRVIPLSRQMDFHYINGYEELEPKPPWGIYEPMEHTPLVEYEQLSGCMLVPGVAFDHHRRRLGYGGGYYDSFLQRMNEMNVPVHKLGLALDLQMVHEVPCEVHDLAVDRLITETRVI